MEGARGSREPAELTLMLGELAGGGPGVRSSVVAFLDRELRNIARGHLRAGRSDAQATELVNEAYLKLFDRERLDLRDRRHFFALAAVAMRQILVDQARRRGRLKRGGDLCVVTLNDEVAGVEADTDLVDLDAALDELAERDERQARIVELRYFVGLEVAAVAELLEVSVSTVEREWRVARAWLGSRLKREDA